MPILSQFSLSQKYKKILFWSAAVVVTAFMAWSLATNTETTVLWSVIALLAWFTSSRPVIGLCIVLLLPVIGELYRLPFGGENGMLISDLAVVIFVGIMAVKRILNGPALAKTPLTVPLAFFTGAAILSLVGALLFVTPKEVFAGSMYLIRLVSYIGLFFVTIESVRTKKDASLIKKSLFSAALLIAAAGFIQLKVFPDLARLEQYGWDPHINRLVSTWLDPNFIGGYLAFVVCLLLGILLYTKKSSRKILILTSIAFLGAALFLTYSRSSYVALAAGVVVISLIRSWKVLAVSLLVFVIGISVSPRADQRVGELAQSISSIVFNSNENPDPTTRLRIRAYEQTIDLIKARPLLGSGYNTLRYVKYDEGFVTDEENHAASGSDSSMLTILATTGILGLIPFVLTYAILLRDLWRKKNTPLALGLLGGTTALLLHSLFVNSLLFAPILIPFWITTALFYATPTTHHGEKQT